MSVAIATRASSIFSEVSRSTMLVASHPGDENGEVGRAQVGEALAAAAAPYSLMKSFSHSRTRKPPKRQAVSQISPGRRSNTYG